MPNPAQNLQQLHGSDIERVKKSACRIILQEKYTGYKNALNRLEIESLAERRENLCLNFALKCTKNKKTVDMFPKVNRKHSMKAGNPEVYIV